MQPLLKTPFETPGTNNTEKTGIESKNQHDSKSSSSIFNDDKTTGDKQNSKYSPLNLPLNKRLQTAFILFHSTSLLLFCSLYFLLWCTPYMWPIMIYYTIFYYLLDRSPVNGGVWYRRSETLRNLSCWKNLVEYFPIKFHKMADLKPTFENIQYSNTNHSVKEQRIGPNYIFGYHPHGIIATGVSSGFTNNGTGWNQMFPGIKCFVTTLVNQFQVPFYRDYLMALGVTTVVKKNLKLILGNGGSVVIVVGGARESLLAKPGLNSIVLNKRKGFIKLALETLDKNGLCLVPVYGFGENDVYNVFFTDEYAEPKSNKQGKINGKDDFEDFEFQSDTIQIKSITKKIKKMVYTFQLFLKNNFGWTLPIIISRGIFNYDFGILPYRRPINVVFGKPITITRLNNLKPGDAITQYEIDYWHDKYVEGLKDVWAWGKPRFINPCDKELSIVE